MRAEQGLFLAAIKDLDAGGFRESEIAELIDDGSGGNLKARARRVREHLGKHERGDRGNLRDRRMKHSRGSTVLVQTAATRPRTT
jgi:hypothetical protein